MTAVSSCLLYDRLGHKNESKSEKLVENISQTNSQPKTSNTMTPEVMPHEDNALVIDNPSPSFSMCVLFKAIVEIHMEISKEHKI